MGDKPNWLFMVYMVAGGSDRLDSLAVQDLQEMERGVAENPNVQVHVQVHRKWPANPQVYTIKKLDKVNASTTTFTQEVPPDLSRPSPSGTLGSAQQTTPSTETKLKPANMGDQKTLTRFLLEAPEAKHYCLVLWGHSYGLGFGREHGDKLKLSELRDSLTKFNETRHHRLDLLGANTCTLAYAEAIFELRESAQFMVASEVFVPFAGWPYQTILREVGLQKPVEVGRIIVNRYFEFYDRPDRDDRVAMTLLDLGKADYLATLIEKLATGIKEAIGEGVKKPKSLERITARLEKIRDAFLINPAGDIRPVLDLVSLADDLIDACEDIVQEEGGSEVVKEVESLIDAAKEVQKLRPLTPANTNTKLILMHKGHPELGELNGVGVFAPFVVEPQLSRFELEVTGKTEDELTQGSKNDYLALSVFQKPPEAKQSKVSETSVVSKAPFIYSTWPNLVFDKLRPERPAEIVDSAGAVRPADRSAVSHMVFAVDAAFRRLDRALLLSQGRLVNALKEKQSKPRLQDLAGFGPPNLRLARDRSMLADPRKFGKKHQVPDNPTEIVRALRSVEETFSRVEQITRRVVTNARFGIGPAASPGGGSGGFDDRDKSIGEGFDDTDKSIGEGFDDTDKSIGEGFAGKSIGEGFGLTPTSDTSDADNLGSQIAFLTADRGLGSLAVIHLFLSIARSFKQVERAIVALEDEVATFLEKPEFGAILSKGAYKKAVEDRIERRFAVLQETCVQARRVVRRVLAHPTFGIGPGPGSIGRGDREALAAQAGLSRQRLLLL